MRRCLVDEIHLTGKYFLMVQDFDAPRADWVAALYQNMKPATNGNAQVSDQNGAEEAKQILETARADAQEAQKEMFSAYDLHLKGLVSIEEFMKAAADFVGVDYDPNSYTGNLAMDMPQGVGLKETQDLWRQYINVKVAIEQKAEWVEALKSEARKLR